MTTTAASLGAVMSQRRSCKHIVSSTAASPDIRMGCPVDKDVQGIDVEHIRMGVGGTHDKIGVPPLRITFSRSTPERRGRPVLDVSARTMGRSG
jgi:hypothetical protein